MSSLLYPLGTQDFPTVRELGMVYVDKTDLIYNLTSRYRMVFLARPRRFGKSLLLSTIQAYFEARENLFEGLKIYELEKNWDKYPVLHLDLSGSETQDHVGLIDNLNSQFLSWEELYGVSEKAETLSVRFANIIKAAHNCCHNKVVVLIDEYDNSLINTLHKSETYGKNRDILKALYSNLKSLDRFLKFVMVTGVFRFSKTTIFSGFNNLTDISFYDRYSTICGFTENEIKRFLGKGVLEMSEKYHITPDEMMLKLKDNYDGYHFSETCVDIYNPFSLLNALDRQKIEPYWMLSGTTEFLAHKLLESSASLESLFTDSVSESSLSEIDTAFSYPLALLYQTGYLTIKEYDPDNDLYKLGVPNNEINNTLFSQLFAYFSSFNEPYIKKECEILAKNLIEGNPNEFLENLKVFFAGISYRFTAKMPELYFENNLFLILKVMNFRVQPEFETSRGRIDLLLKTDRYIYIFEFKVDDSAESALKQIKDKEYHLPFMNEMQENTTIRERKKIFCIGVKFSKESRNIENWEIE